MDASGQTTVLKQLGNVQELKYFYRQDLWKKSDKELRRWKELLGEHGANYFSPLMPIFLNEIRSLSTLNYLSLVKVRDGVLGLIDFFKRYPTHMGVKTNLIIHYKLSPLVPKAWRKQCLFFLPKPKCSIEAGQVYKNLLLAPIFDTYHCDVERVMVDLKWYQSLANQKMRCLVYPIGVHSKILRKVHQTENSAMAFWEKLLKSTDHRLSLLGDTELSQLDFGQLVFTDLGGSQYFYAESALALKISNEGGADLEMHRNWDFYHPLAGTADETVDGGLHHWDLLYEKGARFPSKWEQEMEQTFLDLTRLFGSLVNQRPSEKVSYQRVLMSYAQYVAENLYRYWQERLH